MKKVLKERITEYSCEQKDAIAYALTVYKNDENIKNYLNKLFLKCEIEDILLIPSFSKTSNLSIKVLKNITKYLEQGYIYNEACQKAGYDFKGHNSHVKNKYLLPLGNDNTEITNPVVKRAVSQTIKVINALIRRYGESPVFISVELAREM